MNKFLNNCHSEGEARRISCEFVLSGRRFLAVLGMTAVIYLLSAVSSYGQSKTISKNNDAKSIYVPVKTKMDIAIEREQKKELERAKALEIQKKQAGPYERISLENKANVEMLYGTPVKSEEQILIKEYKEIKEGQEQHLKKEEFQKPEK